MEECPDSPKQSHLEAAALILFILPFINGIYNNALIRQPWFFWILDIIQFIVLPFCMAVFLFTRSGLRAEDVGLGLPRDKSGWNALIIRTFLITILFYFIYRGLHNLFLTMYPATKFPPVFAYQWMMPNSAVGQWVVSIYYAIGGGFSEEFYYRGLLVALFTQYKMKNSVIILCVSSIFALVHWESGPFNILATFFLGVFVTAYFVHFRMLIPLVVGHFVTDFLVFARVF